MQKSILSLVAVSFLGLALSGCSSTPSAPATPTTYPPTNANVVNLYTVGQNPICQNYVSVGTVSVPTVNAMGNPSPQQTINQAMKDAAAALGATGVMSVQNNGANQQTGTAIHCLGRN